ncbi:MAG TPA: Hsp20/alpha crystallin family protein [Candidatus Methanoperedens sp.]|nr:Hsp20/alpha crystallin family protein [Candidatus Methanoperedens sp.]
MAVIRWTPFRELSTVQERMNRLFEDVMRAPYRSDEGLAASAWAPAVDIYETDKEIVLKAELPEMQEKDIDIKVEDNVLSITGERRMEKEVKEENYHRIERSYGSFNRSFTLPRTLDPEGIKAAYKDGVLKVNIPKKEEVKPKQIKIEVGQA